MTLSSESLPLSGLKVLSVEFYGAGPFCTQYAINPGTFNTPIVRTSITSDVEESMELFGKDIPIGRVGDPKEIGQVASFLASDGASFISGEYINVDGGIMAKGGWDADLQVE